MVTSLGLLVPHGGDQQQCHWECTHKQGEDLGFVERCNHKARLSVDAVIW
ncbi:hypothetical protein HanRHA438_Chr17g0814311 [Helianthus annuus]|nr:hypothetical protein HanIR_Chr17g0872451 [Helianthus annuus]KAJ0826439.1 hypothetical protein HanRHA438_Chr17g0814311 [Helianthus annuus]